MWGTRRDKRGAPPRSAQQIQEKVRSSTHIRSSMPHTAMHLGRMPTDRAPAEAPLLSSSQRRGFRRRPETSSPASQLDRRPREGESAST